MPVHKGLAEGKVGHGNEPPQHFAVAYGYTGVRAAMSPFEGNGRAIAQRELQGPSVDKTSDDWKRNRVKHGCHHISLLANNIYPVSCDSLLYCRISLMVSNTVIFARGWIKFLISAASILAVLLPHEY